MTTIKETLMEMSEDEQSTGDGSLIRRINCPVPMIPRPYARGDSPRAQCSGVWSCFNPRPYARATDLVASHELGQKESTQGVVLLLGVEANLSGSALGSVSHLSLRVVRRVAEQVTLRQHTSSDGGAGIAELADVRLLGEGVDTKIHIGVRARLAVNGSNRILKFNFLILGHSVIGVLCVKSQRSKADPLYPP